MIFLFHHLHFSSNIKKVFTAKKWIKPYETLPHLFFVLVNSTKETYSGVIKKLFLHYKTKLIHFFLFQIYVHLLSYYRGMNLFQSCCQFSVDYFALSIYTYIYIYMCVYVLFTTSLHYFINILFVQIGLYIFSTSTAFLNYFSIYFVIQSELSWLYQLSGCYVLCHQTLLLDGSYSSMLCL